MKNEESRLEKQGDYSKVSEIRFGRIPEEEKKLQLLKTEYETIASEERLLKEEVDEEDIAAVVSSWTHIPVSKMLEGEKEKLLRTESVLLKRVVGQDSALSAVADAIRRSRAGITDEDRPIGSFLFLGPTGVGKTELARALSEFLFNDEKALIRIDMSEYMEKHSVSRLIGAPPGYVGYEEGGQLTEAVRRRPYSVVLFDEIEKAHPEVLNALLQVFDDGRLTDGKGRHVDFKNTLLIMTSNLFSDKGAELKKGETDDAHFREALKVHLRPEFINRIDEIILFNRLTKENIHGIVRIQLGKLQERLNRKGIVLKFDDSAINRLAETGFDPHFGARPLKRLIQQEIENLLSHDMLKGILQSGSERTLIFKEGRYCFV